MSNRYYHVLTVEGKRIEEAIKEGYRHNLIAKSTKIDKNIYKVYLFHGASPMIFLSEYELKEVKHG